MLFGLLIKVSWKKRWLNKFRLGFKRKLLIIFEKKNLKYTSTILYHTFKQSDILSINNCKIKHPSIYKMWMVFCIAQSQMSCQNLTLYLKISKCICPHCNAFIKGWLKWPWLLSQHLGGRKQVDLCHFKVILVNIVPCQSSLYSEILPMNEWITCILLGLSNAVVYGYNNVYVIRGHFIAMLI